MSGLLLQGSGAAFGGVATNGAPSYGSAKSYTSGTPSAGIAAFGGPSTTTTPSTGDILHPGKPFGLAFWVGVGSITGLCWLRYSLPK